MKHDVLDVALAMVLICALVLAVAMLLLARLSHIANWKQNAMCDKRLM